MATSAFSRAWQFLKYNAVAQWSALSAAVGTGFLYVGFLFVLVFFSALLVYRGTVPTFDNLPYSQQKAFLQLEQPKNVDWQARLKELGYAPEQIMVVAQYVTGDLAQDAPPVYRHWRRELQWRYYTFQYLRDNISADAAEHYVTKSREVIDKAGVQYALTRDVPDCGVFGLIMHSHNRPFVGFACLAAWLNPWMWAHGFQTYILGLFLIAVVLTMLRAGLMFTNKYMAALAVTEATTRLRRAIYHHTYRLGTLAFRALGPTEAVGVATRHLEAVHDGLYAWLTAYIREPIKFVLLLAFALMVNVWLTVAFVMLAMLVWMIGGQVAAAFRNRGRVASEQAAEQLALMQESLMMMRLVKVYLMELFNQNRVERQLAHSAGAHLRRFRGEAIYLPLLVLFCTLALLALLYIIGIIVAGGQLGVPGAIVLATALVSLYLPVGKWLDSRRQVRLARESAEILFEFLDRPGDVGQGVEADFLAPLEDKLEFKDVHLKDPGTGKKLLQGINLTIYEGQRIAIVGPDDMEKHALVYLIARFLDPTTGEIRIDGHNVREVTLDSLRAQIGMVLQNNLVFNDTVANNIGCGDKSNTLPEIIDASKTAHAHKFIQKLPQGYDTMIGDLGHPLNVGQQFRIALARAILRDPALMIIEEPFVALEEETKDFLDDTMNRVLDRRTVIFLPHRLSTIRRCDNVLLIFNGQVAASGQHKELILENNLYRHLQYLEFNEFADVVGNNAMMGGLM